MKTTNELLLQTRKQATSSFGVKEWTTVMTELGFKIETAKTGRTVTEFKFSIDGRTMVIEKEPRCVRILFYDMTSMLKEAGLNLVEMASSKLGLDTPDVEKKLHDLYVRDLTNTGTCPVCEGNFKLDSGGKIGHHGFTRPGDGWLHGSCFGVKYRPFELDAVGAIDYGVALGKHLVGKQAYLARLVSGEIKSFTKEVSQGYSKPKLAVEVTIESDKYEFESITKQRIFSTEQDIKMITKDIAYFQNKVANWKLDALPEVKHAGKFRVGT